MRLREASDRLNELMKENEGQKEANEGMKRELDEYRKRMSLKGEQKVVDDLIRFSGNNTNNNNNNHNHNHNHKKKNYNNDKDGTNGNDEKVGGDDDDDDDVRSSQLLNQSPSTRVCISWFHS